MLRQLPPVYDRDLLAGDNPADDAAIYRVRSDLALVQSVDFFTPVVDDPYTYGRIAAANALSDIYAVGGEPLTALNIACFPMATLPRDVLAEILRGGAATAAEAGVAIIGGHTIDDTEPKYGLAVTGTVHPDRFLTPRGGQAGDLLVLTKPIGTGLVATALKAEGADRAHVDAAVGWMTALNRGAARAMMDAEAHAATDITGFGLLGHLVDLARASELSARIDAGSVPLLPGAIEYARAGHSPGGTRTNLEYVADSVAFGGADGVARTLLADPQTSGGLLIALPPARLHAFRSAAGAGALAAVVGELTVGEPGRVVLV